MPFSAIDTGHIFAVRVIVQWMPALEALVIVSKLGPNPLVAFVDVAGVVCTVSPRANVILVEMVLTAHPTGSGGRGSEQTQSAEALVEAIALGWVHFGCRSL